jgi:archaellum component FlaC
MEKKELKQVFNEVLEPFAKSVQDDFMKVNRRLDGMDKRLDGMDKRLDRMDRRLEHIDGRIGNFENEWREFRKNSSELFGKLDRFINLYKDQKDELTSLFAQTQRLERRVENLEKQNR